MSQDNDRIVVAELSWWLFVLLVILTGLALYPVYAPRTSPIVHPVMHEGEP